MKKIKVLILVFLSSYLYGTVDSLLLHEAAALGKEKEVNELITHGADVNVKNFSQQTPLHVACKSGQNNIVEILVKNGADVNAEDHLGSTPLHLSKNGEIAEILIKNGASLEKKDSNGATPVWDAALHKCLSVVEVLLDNDANPAVKGPLNKTVLHIACKHNSTEELDALMIVIFLIGKKVNINEQDDLGNIPLHYAAESGSDQIVDFLLKKGANPLLKNNNKKLPLHDAAYHGSVKCVQLLFYNVPAEDLRFVLLDSQDDKGNTPLHYATLNLNEEVVTFLLEQRASFTKTNKFGQRPEDLIIAREDRDPKRESRIREIYTKHKEKLKSKYKKGNRLLKAIRKIRS